MFKDIDEQLKLAHKVIDVVDHANRKICAVRKNESVLMLKSDHLQRRRRK